MFEIRKTAEFEKWLTKLRDQAAIAIIARRIDRMSRGNFGDEKSVGHGVSELRVNFGPGYRVYYVRRGKQVIILLCGGDKGSQRRDIIHAQEIAKEV